MKAIFGALAAFTLAGADSALAQNRITLTSEWGRVTATLEENAATRALLTMLPLTIEMRDHLRQEKTGFLPDDLPAAPRRLNFAKGALGLWNASHFVIYYRDGSVPQPGIVPLGQVQGDISIFDRDGQVAVRLERIE